jgi:hypothetical protein
MLRRHIASRHYFFEARLPSAPIYLFAVEATRRWMDEGIFVNAVNPGAIATNLQKHTGGLKTPPERRKTIQQGGFSVRGSPKPSRARLCSAGQRECRSQRGGRFDESPPLHECSSCLVWVSVPLPVVAGQFFSILSDQEQRGASW